jgi:phage terminase small subunit
MKHLKISKKSPNLKSPRKLRGQQVLPELTEAVGYESIDLLSPEHERFCWHYAVYGNGRAAYQHAYPNASNGTARAEACRLLASPDVSNRLDEIRAEMNKRHIASADDIIHYLSTVFRFDRTELLDKRGSLKTLHDLPMDIAAVLDIDVQLNKSGIQIPVMKIPGRGSAAAELARIYGLYKDKLHLSGDLSKMSEEEAKAELKHLAYEVLEGLKAGRSALIKSS